METHRIDLPGGHVALVSLEDRERVSAFRWHVKKRKAWSERPYVQSYTYVEGKRTFVSLHRFVLAAGPGELVDHINGDPLDNRRENLRLATVSQNGANIRASVNQRRGGYKGVTWNKACEKWQASLKDKGVSKYLGLFADPAEAARAYDRAAREHFGEFAAVNFPREAA